MAMQIDRSFRVRKLNLHFPFPAHKTSAQTPPVLDKTLLDGEMVIDHVDNVVRHHSLLPPPRFALGSIRPRRLLDLARL
jgi:hypothetical protein